MRLYTFWICVKYVLTQGEDGEPVKEHPSVTKVRLPVEEYLKLAPRSYESGLLGQAEEFLEELPGINLMLIEAEKKAIDSSLEAGDRYLAKKSIEDQSSRLRQIESIYINQLELLRW